MESLFFPEYFPETGTLTFLIKEGKIIESDEVNPNLLVDYGADNQILQFDIWYAKEILYDFNSSVEEYGCESTLSKKTIKMGNDSIIQLSSYKKTDDPRIDIMHYDEKWTAIVIHDK